MWLTVSEVVQETSEATSFVFEQPPLGGPGYRPGQFLTLRIPSDRTGSVARCYSLSSAPDIDDKLMVTVKRTAGGFGSNWLCDNVVPGDRIESLAPSGAFTPKRLDTNLLLVAGGSGITPILSIVKSVLVRGTGDIVLLYANRDPESVIFAGALRDLADRYPDRLTVIHWIEKVQGIPSLSSIANLLRPYADFEAFLCGPPAFMTCVRRALESNGAPRSRIHMENFVSLTGDSFSESDSGAVESEGDTEQLVARLTVELDGATHVIRWPRSRTLVDLLIDQGLEPPYSCREGNCGTCQCLVLAGAVDMDFQGVLDDADVADRVVLACQARPASDEVAIEF